MQYQHAVLLPFHSYEVFAHRLLFVKVSTDIPPSHFLTFAIILSLINTENVALRAPRQSQLHCDSIQKIHEKSKFGKIRQVLQLIPVQKCNCRWHCVI
jgi:hypothetical protein